MSDPRKLARELEGIREEIEEKIGEAESLLREAPAPIRGRAEAYWLPHLYTALSDDHGYVGGSMATLSDTIQELRESAPRAG